MGSFKQIIRWLVVIGAVGWCLYEWVFVSDGPAYFAADWRRVGFVVIVSVVGGLAVFGFMQFPERVRQRLAATIFALGAALAVVDCAYSVWRLLALREVLAEARIVWLLTAVELAMWSCVGGLCVWLWRRYRKRDENRPG